MNLEKLRELSETTLMSNVTGMDIEPRVLLLCLFYLHANISIKQQLPIEFVSELQ